MLEDVIKILYLNMFGALHGVQYVCKHTLFTHTYIDIYIYIHIYIYIYDAALPVPPIPLKGYPSTGPGEEMIPAPPCGWVGVAMSIFEDTLCACKKVVMIPAAPFPLWVGGGGYVTTGGM